MDTEIYTGVTLFEIFKSLLILLVIVIIGKVISLNIRRTLKDKASKDLVVTLSKIINYLALFIGFLFILPILQISVSGLLVAGGIMAIVIGFASQSIVSNVISGIFLIFERPIRIDDVVNIDGNLGMVEDIRIISTSIRTFDGVYVRIPNATVFTGTITNFLENIARRFEYDIGIRYQDDADRAMEMIKELVDEHPLALKNPAPQLFVQNLGASAVELKARVWAPSTDWFQVRMELLWRIKKTLEENDIKVPFTQQEIWFMNQMEKKS